MLNKIKHKIDKQKEKRFWKKYNKKYVNPTQWQYVRSNDRNTVLSKNVKFSKDWNKTLRANHVCVFGGSLKEQEDSIILPNIQIGFNKIPENSPASVGSGMNPVFLYVKSFFLRNLSYLS